jgi:hypothetical protein
VALAVVAILSAYAKRGEGRKRARQQETKRRQAHDFVSLCRG